jgi:hypothetical protein
MSEIKLTTISQFMDRYRRFTSEEVTQYIDQFQGEFERLKKAFTHIREEVIEEARKTAPAYNIFSVLGLSRNETRTHSAMLANLLDPGGSHGQRHLFLETFLERCTYLDPNFPLPSEAINSGRWEVICELITLFGRLDIVIRSADLNFLCVIENKVDASEQVDQLLRYSRWMETQLEGYSSQALIYLSIHGDPAYTAQGVPYLRLSYRRDIAQWLEETLSEIEAPNVRGVVEQYRNLVRIL